MRKYIFRIFEGWMIWDGMISEQIIEAADDAAALEKATDLANGRAFSCNRMWTVDEH